MRDIKPGDFIDVRMIAVAVKGSRIVARLPSQNATHQVVIGSHQVKNVEARSPDAVAADVLCSSYGGVAPVLILPVVRAN